MRIPLAFLLFLVVPSLSCLGAPSSDFVESLPGQPSPAAKFKQYSGYIAVDPQAGRALFYYFVEAVSVHAASKPLTLWLNGGPGCSSLGGGAFTEIGPFQPHGNKLIRNTLSWNRESNLLFLESPAGVGFSYSNDTAFYRTVNDAITAQDSLQFLLNWFAKFPEYRGRDFYITGESYAGHYIPQLATLLRQYMHTNGNGIINLKAIAIGNPLLDFVKDSTASNDFLWSHGLINDEIWKKVGDSCDWTSALTQYAHNQTYPTKCAHAMNESNNAIGHYINSYDVIIDVCLSGSNGQAITIENMKRKLINGPEYSLGQDVCVSYELVDYLNRIDVQDTLHVYKSNLSQVPWTGCSSQIDYELLDLLNNMIPILKGLINDGLRVLIYSGDEDSVIPLSSTRTLIDELAMDLQLKPTITYSAWYSKKQVAGWTEGYGNLNLTYATVRGAAHQVPTTQPARALTLFQAFIHNQPLPSKP